VEKGPALSDFAVTQLQRRRLLEGNYRALKFLGAADPERKDPLPHGCKVGARYVLAWQRASATAYEDEDGGVFVARTLRVPLWFITVTKITGAPGPWTVRFDVTDLRDSDLWLRRGGGYQTTPKGSPDVLPVAPSDETRRKAMDEFWHLQRLQQHAERQRQRARERSKARRKRAA